MSTEWLLFNLKRGYKAEKNDLIRYVPLCVNVVMNFNNLKPPFGSFSMFLHVIIPFWSFLVKSDFFNFLIGAISA